MTLDSFNQLTPAEEERLAMLMEECSEIIQIGCKILRHGYASYHPQDPQRTSNRRLLEKEVEDAKAIMELMRGDLTNGRETSVFDVIARKRPYMHHQD